MGLLDGKVAIVTGAGRGLGRRHALALARAGAAVVVNDLGVSTSGEGRERGPATKVAGEIEAAGGRAVANFGDVSDFEEAAALVDQAVAELGGLDILVNNAGVLRDRMLVNMTEQEWDVVVRTHLNGHFAPLRHAASLWRERSKDGQHVAARVINTTSSSGLFGSSGQANYGAAKAGIAALTIVAALELGRYGVTVNCIAPNARTRMTKGPVGEIPKPDAAFDAMHPAQVSPLVVALASDAAADITGQCFFVYGGTINVLEGWDAGVLLKKEEGWEPDELIGTLSETFPNGAAPEGMMPMMVKATGGEGMHRG